MQISASTRRWAIISGSVVGGIVLVLVVALAVLWFVQRDRVLPNTSVAGTDVGGMTEAELRETLEPIAEDREGRSVVFNLDQPLTEATVQVHPRDVGYRVEVDHTVDTTLAYGRKGLPGDILTRVRALRRAVDLPLAKNSDPQALAAWASDVADELDQTEQRGDVTVDPETLTVTVEPSRGRVEVDRGRLADLADDALLTGDDASYELPAETTPQPIADRDLEEVAEQLEQALAEPLVLTGDDNDLTLEPTLLVELIEVVEADGGVTGLTLALEVDADVVDEELGEVARGRFDVEPENASYSASRTPPATFDVQGSTTYQPVEASVEVEPGIEGREFDPERTAEQLTHLVRSGAREAEVDLATVEPEFSTEDAEELAPTHAIGTFTTYFTAGQSRVHNIQLLADIIDGTLTLPGEQFSINETSGPRSCDRGFLEAGTIIQGELEDTCGGGTSQFGTTTFNAAFFAGVQLDQWRAHSWYISRYPMGREATLSFGVLDVRFTNNTPGAILVKTAHTASSVTVTLYGQPRANAVSATHSSPSNYRSYDTERRLDSDLAPGQERVLQSGGDGFQVSVTRTIDLIDGGEETRTINTTYVPQTRIVEYGPEPDDDEDEDDD